MIFVGIDWADKEHEVCVLDQDGTELAHFRIPHTCHGLETLKKQLLRYVTSPEEAPCFLETSQGLLVQFLLEAGFPVYPLNPKVVDYRRKPSGAKSDTIDARLLADIGRSDLRRLRRLNPDSELIQELKTLCRDQDILLEEVTRLTNRLTACLKEYYPVALELFSRLTLPVTLNFLKTYPTLEAARSASVPELAAFLKAHRHPKPNLTAQRIYAQLHAPQLEARPAVVRAKSRFMPVLIAQLEPLLEAIKKYDEEITRLFKSHPDSLIFASLPGAGTRLGPRLLAGWGDDRGRYESAAAVQALAGTSPVLYQSGKYRFARQRRACIKFLRLALQLFAYQSVLKVSWARDYYQRKRAAGKTHHEALRALANIWVRIIFAMWLNRRPYDESVFLAARARHAPSVA
ncbi:IS110 family transposase [Ammonifex thiophilus]|uniref:IS110 family transposase n=4 Tax=Ammonifex thiophilus TaxID=444093 RepID=A0A3D8P1Z8_9THEO|nr:IS110 family transposase [Ammonifex thiophilus]RDV80506.1 IS110 family transposase [Ammonifex thiophilus]